MVGRGLVVAGAGNIREFAGLMMSDRSAIVDAPSDRWRSRAGVEAHDGPLSHKSPHCRGGFVKEFVFDGAKYRIPPRQVQQANPAQMMLIDAVSQALSELNSSRFGDSTAGMGIAEQWPFDRQRVGVVIGTIFGGEFGDQLQVGMRLPEICEQLVEAMMHRGVSEEKSRSIADDYRRIVLQNRPALLDETGSFTASTLASRVAKTFDLMGGAAALDADDTSGLAGLMVAVDQLKAGSLDLIICGSAQRSMSLAAYEALDMAGRLVRSGRIEDIPDDCSQIIPGEGVVALMLCRLSDARRLELPIYGVFDDVCQVTGDAGHSSSEIVNAADSEIVRRIGHVAGAHSLIRMVAETLQRGGDAVVTARANDGVVLQTVLRTGGREFPENPFVCATKSFGLNSDASRCNVESPRSRDLSNRNPSAGVGYEESPPFSQAVPVIFQPQISRKPASVNSATMDLLKTRRHIRVFRFAAMTVTELKLLLSQTQQNPAALFADAHIARLSNAALSSRPATRMKFADDDFLRVVIAASDPDQLRTRIAVALKTLDAGRTRAVLDRDRIILWQTFGDPARVAWLFPGQGSHYSDAPAIFAVNEHAREMLEAVDHEYAANNLPRLSSAFGNPLIKPGEDIWWAQAWVLGASAAFVAALKAEGLRPDVVLGHSFGEFTASLAANVTTLSETIELARHRAHAVISHMRTPGGLLSVRAAVHEVDTILKSAALPVYITHLNSPKQTVIAGSRDGIAAARALMDEQSLAAMLIPVPAPFHTPLLADAEVAFERMSSSVPMRPPICGFLSATFVQYLAEPSGIRQSLVRQLTQPVMYLPSIQRMMGEGIRVFLEVGPNDVLTRMNRDILDSQALCLSLDVPGQPFDERLALVHAAIECVTGTRYSEAEIIPSRMESIKGVSRIESGVSSGEVSLFDVTRARRAKNAGPAPVVNSSDQQTGLELHSPSSLLMLSSEAASSSTPQREAASIRPPQKNVQPSQIPVVEASSFAVSDERLRVFTRDLVVELTGYSSEIIDFEADLEADLGIDSIKKAQVLGELGEWLGFKARPDSLRLDSVRSLNDVIREMLRLARENVPVTSREVPPMEQQVAGPTLAPSIKYDRDSGDAGAVALPPDEKLDGLLIDYVIDQTGYSRDLVDLDADLEADLGLDSIKLAQLIGEMREQFHLESLTQESIAEARFRTLRGIREFLIQQAGGRSKARAGSEQELKSQGGSRGSQDFRNDEFLPGPASLSPDCSETMLSYSGESAAIRGTTAVHESSGLLPKPPSSGEPDHVYVAARSLGEQDRSKIRAALRSLIYRPGVNNRQLQDSIGNDQSAGATVAAHIGGIAAGAGVAPESIARIVGCSLSELPRTSSASESVTTSTDGHTAVSTFPELSGTHRFLLRVLPSPRRAGMPLLPELKGAALILGSNMLAETLAERIRELGQSVLTVHTDVPIDQIENSLEQLWRQTPTPHLFLTMAFDALSQKSLREGDWHGRRPAALETPFRICQLWMAQMIASGLMEDASVIAVTQLGGDFGFSGRHIGSIEAIGGLVKAMLIEAWMRGFRTTPMKVIDVAPAMNVAEVARGVLQELAVPSYDMEIGFRPSLKGDEPERYSVQAVGVPLESGTARASSVIEQLAKSMSIDRQVLGSDVGRITRGGTWIVTGGGRGITAVIAMTLAKQYDLKLHLLGTAPVPQLSDEFVSQVAADRSGVRRGIMQDASSRGENPVEAWRKIEKSIEVDATLRECRARSIPAVYHCCDVADFDVVEKIISEVRRRAGPIRGVIHGAGVGQDARFDRKRPEKVEKCLKAKIDGSLAVMRATNSDPLEWFVAFGSISGRFGANGHTDYSLANDMMAKIVDRYRMERPDVRSVTFHWHAWGDIGMATKPEARLALEMIDMEFMPASDGVAHFMRELEFGGDEPEVLITDESYFRRFFPAERLSVSAAGVVTSPRAHSLPLLPPTVEKQNERVCSRVVTLNPLSDKFLSQHRVQGKPTLPFVVAVELMAEAVRAHSGLNNAGFCLNARVAQAIRFETNDPLAVTVQSALADDGTIECRLLADVRRRDGRVVEVDREYFRATFDPQQTLSVDASLLFVKPVGLRWKRIEYGPPDGLIYHGPEMQELREIADDGDYIWGRIAASAPVQLFGGLRASGFSLSCSTMDACLYAIGYTAWQRYHRPSLPIFFDRIEPGRLPDPGEPCLVRIRELDSNDSGALWDFDLQGYNGDRILTVRGYRIGWLRYP
ncbi:MAG: SDR family NAD(P)-dependent oxidoreductase [Planctomycetota bacterium]